MPSPAVLVTRRLPAGALKRLSEQFSVTVWPEERPMPYDAMIEAVAGKAALLTMLTDKVDATLLEAAGTGLRVVANYAVGFDNVDVASCSARGVMVTNTPDVLTESTADMAFALLLGAARRLAEGDRFLREGASVAWAPDMMLGVDVHGKTLGVVGFGRIGRAVARRAAGFAMRVVVHTRGHLPADAAAEKLPLDELFARSDFVTLHVRLDDGTRHLVDGPRLARMKPTAVLVNTSRGPVVDEAALADALARRVIFAAGLDVYEREPQVHPLLLESPFAVLAPHLGSATVETRADMADLAAENVIAALEGLVPPCLVNRELLG